MDEFVKHVGMRQDVQGVMHILCICTNCRGQSRIIQLRRLRMSSHAKSCTFMYNRLRAGGQDCRGMISSALATFVVLCMFHMVSSSYIFGIVICPDMSRYFDPFVEFRHMCNSLETRQKLPDQLSNKHFRRSMKSWRIFRFACVQCLYAF